MLAGIEIVCQQLSADGTDSHWNVRVLSYTYDCDYSKRTFSLVTTKRKKRKKNPRNRETVEPERFDDGLPVSRSI